MTVCEHLTSDFINWICYLFTRDLPHFSAFIMILGRRGTGKTDLGLLITEILFEKGVIKHFCTNTKIYEAPFEFEQISNLDDLTYWAENTRGVKLFMFDEIGKGFKRRKPMSSLNVHLIDEFHILRKHKMHVVATTINEDYVDNAVLGSDILDGYFEKPDFKNPKKAQYLDYLEFFTQSFYDLRETSVKYDTWDSAPFTEHGKTQKPRFNEQHLNTLWEWSHGKTAKELGLHRMEINRLVRKYIKESLEKESRVT